MKVQGEEEIEAAGLEASSFVIGVSFLMNLTSPLATTDVDVESIIAVVVVVVVVVESDGELAEAEEEEEEVVVGEKMLQSLVT